MAKLLTTKQTQRILGINRGTLHRWAKKGLLTKLKVSEEERSTRYDAQEVASLFKKQSINN